MYSSYDLERTLKYVEREMLTDFKMLRESRAERNKHDPGDWKWNMYNISMSISSALLWEHITLRKMLTGRYKW